MKPGRRDNIKSIKRLWPKNLQISVSMRGG
jgi:hypothetical protein